MADNLAHLGHSASPSFMWSNEFVKQREISSAAYASPSFMWSLRIIPWHVLLAPPFNLIFLGVATIEISLCSLFFFFIIKKNHFLPGPHTSTKDIFYFHIPC